MAPTMTSASAADTAQLLSLFLATPAGWQFVDTAAAQQIDRFVAVAPHERGVDVIARARRGSPDARGFYFVVSSPVFGKGFESFYMIGFRDRGDVSADGSPLPGPDRTQPHGRSDWYTNDDPQLAESLPRVAGVLTAWVTIQDFLDVIGDPEATLAVQVRLQSQLALAS